MSQSFDGYVSVSLTIESVELPASVLTEQIGMHPDSQWGIGEPRGRLGRLWDNHGWRIVVKARAEDHGGQSVDELIPIAFEAFERRLAPIAKSVSSLDASAERYVLLYILADYVPGIELNQSFLRLLAELGGTFQVDIAQVPSRSGSI